MVEGGFQQEEEVDSEWIASVSQYWRFVERFKGRPVIGRGDARAYVSALTDIIAVEAGVTDIKGLKWAFGEAVREAYREGLTEERYTRILQKWVGLNRKQLQGIQGNSPARPGPHTPKGDWGLTVISLFTGSYGLDLGFEYAGFRVAVALDNDPVSREILSSNRPAVPFILEDIARVPTKEILAEAGLGRGEVDVLTGGPPCQPFSTAGRRKGLGDPRASPLREFIRVINEAQPKAFVMEEVTGLLNARLRHVPIRERNRELLPEELPGSLWRVVLEELGKTGYRIVWGVLNAADFGAPQVRERVFVIGVRRDLGVRPRLPLPVYTKPSTHTLFSTKPWRCLLDGLAGVEPGDYIDLPPKYKKYIKYVPPGGNWRQIPRPLLPDAMNGAFTAGGGRMGFYRRLSWFEPSPTLVTSPVMKGSMLVHPTEDRPLSVNEYKVIQGFPQDWVVPGPLGVKYRKIGEAVPPLLSYSIALALRGVLAGTGRAAV